MRIHETRAFEEADDKTAARAYNKQNIIIKLMAA